MINTATENLTRPLAVARNLTLAADSAYSKHRTIQAIPCQRDRVHQYIFPANWPLDQPARSNTIIALLLLLLLLRCSWNTISTNKALCFGLSPRGAQCGPPSDPAVWVRLLIWRPGGTAEWWGPLYHSTCTSMCISRLELMTNQSAHPCIHPSFLPSSMHHPPPFEKLQTPNSTLLDM